MQDQFREIWRRKNIDDMKSAVKRQLDEIQTEQGIEAKLQYLLQEIQRLEQSSDPAALLRRFILVISCLYHHQRFGGLGKKQIHDLSDLAAAILMVSGIKPGSSQLSFLYAELHFVLSDLHLANGEFLPALWEQQLGSQMAVLSPEMKGRRQLGMGVHSLRLGNTGMALIFFQNAIDSIDDPEVQDKVRIHQVRALRLSGSIDEAHELAKEYQEKSSDPAYGNEFRWEIACCEVNQQQDLNPLVKLCRRGSAFYTSSYVLELFLWLRCHQKTHWLEKLPKLNSLGQYQTINFRHYPHLYGIAQQLEAAYDTSIPFANRLSSMKKILGKISLLRNIDKELLSWLAITRWLYRNRYAEIAGIIFHEYSSLSQKLSQGRSRDVLGLAADLVEVDWKSKVS
ncbi:MAG: hypothetical protein ACOH5I_13200 [Oligoflexus sp.]